MSVFVPLVQLFSFTLMLLVCPIVSLVDVVSGWNCVALHGCLDVEELQSCYVLGWEFVCFIALVCFSCRVVCCCCEMVAFV